MVTKGSGVNKDGSLRVVRNGMGIYEQAAIELPGVEGTRSLRSGDASTHPSGDTHLLVSFATLRPLERIVLLEMASTVMPATACTSEDLNTRRLVALISKKGRASLHSLLTQRSDSMGTSRTPRRSTRLLK